MSDQWVLRLALLLIVAFWTSIIILLVSWLP